MYIGHEIQNQFSLSSRKPWKKALSSSLGLFVIAVMITLFVLSKFKGLDEFLTTDETALITTLKVIGIVLVGAILLFFLVYLYELWYMKSYQYDLTEDYVIIKKGPIAPQEITIPYDRIQDVYLDQDLLDRLFGLYDVHISTATVTSGVRAHIDGVDRKAALGLREIILKKIKEKK